MINEEHQANMKKLDFIVIGAGKSGTTLYITT